MAGKYLSTSAIAGGMPTNVASLWAPALLPRVHDDPWSHRPPDDEEAVLAAEELAWDKKMSALRQTPNKGPVQGTIAVEHTEDDPEMEESASDDFMDTNTRNDVDGEPGALDWGAEATPRTPDTPEDF